MGDKRDELDEVVNGVGQCNSCWIRDDGASYPMCVPARVKEQARTIRSRERKLAELAREMAEFWTRVKHEMGDEFFHREVDKSCVDWLRRYEEALK